MQYLVILTYHKNQINATHTSITTSQRRDDYAKMYYMSRKKEATIPDRDSFSSRKKLCADYHGIRLKNDLLNIMEVERRRRISVVVVDDTD